MSGKKKKRKRDPLFGGSWFAYLLLALLAIAAAQSVFSMIRPSAPVYQQPAPLAPMQPVQRGEIEVLSDAPPAPTRDSGFDEWLPTHMAPTATAQAEVLEEFYENHPDYTPQPTWQPPADLPTVTPVPQEAVLVALPAPQWNCGCINGQCEWTMVPVMGDYVDANLNLYAYGTPNEEGVIDMRDFLVGTPGARPEGTCTP
jgi:hypothetical protein